MDLNILQSFNNRFLFNLFVRKASPPVVQTVPRKEIAILLCKSHHHKTQERRPLRLPPAAHLLPIASKWLSQPKRALLERAKVGARSTYKLGYGNLCAHNHLELWRHATTPGHKIYQDRHARFQKREDKGSAFFPSTALEQRARARGSQFFLLSSIKNECQRSKLWLGTTGRLSSSF